MEDWLPAGLALADAQTWSMAGPAPTSTRQKVQVGNLSHHPAWTTVFLILQALSALAICRIWHTQCSGQGPAPNLTAWALQVCVQALDNSWSGFGFVFLQLFSLKVPIKLKLSVASAVEIRLS